MTRQRQLTSYIFCDFFSALLAWACFYLYRKIRIEPKVFDYSIPVELSNKFYLGIVMIPLFWVTLYYVTGYYREVFRKSRLEELSYTFKISLFGIVILFFSVLLDDTIDRYTNYYQSFSILFVLHFTITYFSRLIVTSRTKIRIRKGLIGFNTLIVGGSEKAVRLFNDLKEFPSTRGNNVIGFINLNNGNGNKLEEYIKNLGKLSELKEVIEKYRVKEVVIAVEYNEQGAVNSILDTLIDCNVIIKVIPGMYEIFTGKVKTSSILGTPLIEISHEVIPGWQENVKYFVDIFLSLLAVILLSPLIIFLIIGIKLTSKGPVFYMQERIGKNGKPFRIIKFRSMYIDAETNGPVLSSKDDERATPFGRFMRRSRLDEIPNFLNVLKGDMSLVGPRPERKYFIDKIVVEAPQYKQLLKVKPGITSWGQVKYGYAENIEQMIRRMKYDLIYIDNMSLYIDFKIMIYTILIVIKGEGI